MHVVPVPGRRSTVEDTPDGLQIVIPTKKNWFLILFLGLWLCGWLFAEIAAPTAFLSEETSAPPAIFVILWLGGWTVAGCIAIYLWLWTLVGKEIIVVGDAHLTIKRDVFGYGRLKRYESSSVQDFRLSPPQFNSWDFQSGLRFWGIGGGLIAFDYGSSTIRFGNGIEEAEASTILDEIAGRLPIESS